MHAKWWHTRLMALPLPLRRMVLDVVTTQPAAPRPTLPATSSLRHIVFTASPTPSRHRDFSTTRLVAAPSAKSTKSTTYKKSTAPTAKSKKKPENAAPPREEHIPSLSYLPTSSSTTLGAEDTPALLAQTPSSSSLAHATAIFLNPKPRFLYSAPRFLNLPVNTHIPEVCILGRSNVGKSTLLNALAGIETRGKAGRSHGAKPNRSGLAITSARAGCTTMMNGYGFGPRPRAGKVPSFGDAEHDVEEPSKSSPGSRSQRRAQKGAESFPTHRLVLIDMPGYGFMSRSEWGVEIAKYLQRRVALRGAVVLVDAVAGIKDGDRQALRMLRDANVRTMVVLTKADKLLSGASTLTADNLSGSDGEPKLRESCARVWQLLREIESGSGGTVPWMEGQGWEREVFVTGAGDPKGGGFGVAGTRLAICRMADLVPATHAKKPSSKTNDKRNEDSAAVPRTVPFDQIHWAQTTTEMTLDQTEEHKFISEMEAAKKEAASPARPTAGRRRAWRSGSATRTRAPI